MFSAKAGQVHTQDMSVSLVCNIPKHISVVCSLYETWFLLRGV